MSDPTLTDPAAFAAGLTGDDIVTPFEIKPLGTRGRMVRLGASVTELLSQHDYPDEVAAVLAEAIALAALLGTTLKFDGRFILQTQTDGPIDMMVVDFMTPGQIRAYARFDHEAVQAVSADGPADASVYLGKGHLAMTVDQGSDMDRYQGIVALDGVSLSEAAHGYFAQSEQIPTSVRLAAGRVVTPGASGGTEWRAGGILVQHLPSEGMPSPIELSAGDAPEGYEAQQLPEDDNWTRARVLMETTEDHELIDPQLTTDRLLYRLYHEDGATAYTPIEITCKCHCSRERISEVLRNFDPDELAETIQDGKIIVNCEFCSRSYEFDPAEFA